MTAEKIDSITLPEKIDGQYWIEGKISIEGENESWMIKSNKEIKIVEYDKEQEIEMASIALEPMRVYYLKQTQNNEKLILFTEPVTSDRQEFQKKSIEKNVQIAIGRGKTNNIVLNNQFVSAKHALLSFENEKWTIEDTNSTNGTYVNERRIEKKNLNIGDVIYIMGFKIIIGKNFIAYNNPDGQVEINANELTNFTMPVYRIAEDEVEEVPETYFYRSPRFKRDVETFALTIYSPPKNQIGEEIPMIYVLGPSITMGMASLSTAAFSISNAVATGNISTAMPSLITSGSMLLGTLLWPMLSKRFDRKRRRQKEKKRQEKYKAYLHQVEDQIREETGKQKEILQENNVSLEECIERIEKVERNLWERSIGQNDFLKLRVGNGDMALDANIQYQGRKFDLEEDNLEEELYRIGEEPKVIQNVPITISLQDDYLAGVIGNRQDEIELAKALILQISALYSYDEVKMVFLYDEAESKEFEFVKWLPHVWSNERTIRYVATNQNEVKEISAVLEREIEKRKEIPQEKIQEVVPYYMIFAMSRDLSIRADMIKQIRACKHNIGMSIIHFFDELKNIPKECTTVVELAEENSKIYDKHDLTGKFVAFKPDKLVVQDMNQLSVKLANVKLDLLDGSYKLPKLITFLELFGVGKVEHLNALARWKENDPTKTLETPIGINTLGDTFKLDLHENFHGPHGLIAGMTGSRKIRIYYDLYFIPSCQLPSQ